MTLRSDTRAVAPVLGAVLLFGIAVVAFSGYQATVVPNQNAEVEYNHFQEVKDQMVALQVIAADSATTGLSRMTTIDPGTEYPSRLLGINPPPPTGALTTTDTTITITYTKNQGNGKGGVRSRNVTAQRIQYQPQYHEFHPGILRYEHGLLYLDPSSGAPVRYQSQNKESPLIEENTLSLVLATGTIEQSGRTVTPVDISKNDTRLNGGGQGSSNSDTLSDPNYEDVKAVTFRTEAPQVWEKTFEANENKGLDSGTVQYNNDTGKLTIKPSSKSLDIYIVDTS